MVGLEGVGIPLPGETTLIAAAVFAGSSHDLKLSLIVAAAAGGAILGDNLGFALGRSFGYPLLLRYHDRLRIDERKLKLGHYLFLRHGSKVAFVGRFVALLRCLAPFLAGANRMSWPRYAIADALGAVVWATLYGGGAYFLGRESHRLAGPLGWGLLALSVPLIIAAIRFFRAHQAELEAAAERAFPGPLSSPGKGGAARRP